MDLAYTPEQLAFRDEVRRWIAAAMPPAMKRKADAGASFSHEESMQWHRILFQLSDGGWFVQQNAIQLHGGIGITDEQDEGLFFKRLRVLQGLFGDADYHVDRFQRLGRFERS